MIYLKKGLEWLTSLTPLLVIFLLVTIMTLSNDTARQNTKLHGKKNTLNLQVKYLSNCKNYNLCNWLSLLRYFRLRQNTSIGLFLYFSLSSFFRCLLDWYTASKYIIRNIIAIQTSINRPAFCKSIIIFRNCVVSGKWILELPLETAHRYI